MDQLFDLYLYNMSDTNKMLKVPDLSREDADTIAKFWFEENEQTDYILVIKGSVPWIEKPEITLADSAWINDILKGNL